MTIEFNHFSPQAFERMVQALSASILGPGVVVFGAGPDGAREATFQGEVPFPSTTERWNGYVVVQAKCRERLRNSSQDADWLAGQLTEELKKFLGHKRVLRKPEFYILATNVTLSPEPKNGGKAKIEALFERFELSLGLKGHAVWSADELRVHLENATDVRLAYSAWLTPSDVLATLIKKLSSTNLQRLLPLALARDLRNERDVRLRDAGQETEKPIYLDDVFVDLPIVDEQLVLTKDDIVLANPIGTDEIDFEPPRKNAEDRDEGPTGVVARLLTLAADKLDPESIEATSKSSEGDANQAAPQSSAHQGQLPNHVVILGGPGQGKSTLGQFLAQVARARILRAHEAGRLNPETRAIIEPVLTRAQLEGLPVHGPARFPIRVDLPSFADSLSRATAQHSSQTLGSFIATRLSHDIGVQIAEDDWRSWVGTCPSLIILDGLDEVPPSGNRTSVVAAIAALWDDLYLVNADTLIVVTTRPQGYN